MKEKEMLFKLAVEKVSNDPAFIAYHLKYLKEPHKLLACSRLSYLKLALCLVPKDLKSLKRICDYTGVNHRNFELKFFLKNFFNLTWK